MNFEVFVLGTSGMMPLPGRFLTSAMVRREGELFLFDCGEGTQISLKMLNIKWKKISAIFISHMHADHVTGLPGMLMLSSQVDREDPLIIYGPARLKEYVHQMRKLLDMYINYEIIVKTVSPGIIHETEDFSVEAFKLDHTKPCYGYTMREKSRPGIFHPEKAIELGLPRGPLWSRLQQGESVQLDDGRTIHPSDILGPTRSGRSFSYVTDTLYLDSIARHVKQVDLLLCEGMFDQTLVESARDKKHMTAKQAATIARDAQVNSMGLIHYSPRYTDRDLKILRNEAREIFPATFLARDRMVFDIPLKD
ncbi:MAG TPA: ribonuclease Z [Sphaerochaetaceae bacterium]|jgi:ribonuclease Z|nr:ribonuclease Z [Sphaerochaetaceae bacterium]